ncbi:MAG: hypothetical protein K9M13_02440 [Simkaniaceae bacterium]|nr:hypothetical protein [Simkaniaceae bacterium]
MTAALPPLSPLAGVMPPSSCEHRLSQQLTRIDAEIHDYTYFGDVSVPGISNLIGSICNIFHSVILVAAGALTGTGELVRDGTVKIITSAVTLAHAVMTLCMMLAPAVRSIEDFIQSFGSAFETALNYGGIIIAGLEMAVTSWQLFRQVIFDNQFCFQDFLETDYEFDPANFETSYTAWHNSLLANEKAITAFLGEGMMMKIMKSPSDFIDITQAQKLQTDLKTAFYQRNFELLKENYLIVDSTNPTDRSFIQAYPGEAEGKERLHHFKSIRLHRRTRCLELTKNLLVFTKDNEKITTGNLEEFKTLFTKIKQKSDQIKLIHTIALVGLIGVALAFSFVTAGIGSPALFTSLFWAGASLTTVSNLMQTCVLPSYNHLVDFRYFLPAFIRKSCCSEEVHPVDLRTIYTA